MRKGEFLPRVKRICKCGNEFEVRQKRVDQGKGQYCSKKCMYQFRVRPSGLKYKLVNDNPTSFKKGFNPWNKGTVGICKPNSGSIKKGQRISKETEFKKGCTPLNWKGDKVGYNSLHRWVQRHKGKASICSVCGTDKNVQWANLSHEYKRDLNDFEQMCGKCHRAYDKDYLGIATKKFNLKHRSWKDRKRPA